MMYSQNILYNIAKFPKFYSFNYICIFFFYTHNIIISVHWFYANVREYGYFLINLLF